jgi:hypothetical protein
MKALFLLPVLLLAACDGDGGNNEAAPQGTSGGPVQTATLTGLYEGGGAGQRSQLCMIGDGGRARFGLVVRSGADLGCSGSGTASREGGRLRLVMAGSESCTIDAQLDGTRLTFAADQAPGCSYYCSPGARFAGTRLDKIGGSEADARRAQDLVGGPLCG